MNKKLIALAVAGALAAPMAAQAADGVAVSGFVDTFWTLTDESADVVGPPSYNTAENLFTVPETEVDFMGSGVRLDLNNIGGATTVEQANFTTDLGGSGWSLTGGTFNSNITADAQDAPDMQMSQNSLPFLILNADSAANLSGLSVSGMAGPANVTVMFVNDPTNVPTDDQKNSAGLMVSGSVMEGLDLEFSYLGQDKSYGDLMDLNGMYTMDGLTVGLDFLTADAQDTTTGLPKNAYSLVVGYDFGNGFGVKVRTEKAEFEDTGASSTADTEINSVAVTYAMNDNLTFALENDDNKTATLADPSKAESATLTTLELIATF